MQKKFLPQLKDLYKTLLKIAEIQYEGQVNQQIGQASLDMAMNTLSKGTRVESDLVEQFKAINQYAFDWKRQMRGQYIVHDFGSVFEKYINN